MKRIVVEPVQKMELKLKQELQSKEQYRLYRHKQLEASSSVKKLSLEGKLLFPSTSKVPYKTTVKITGQVDYTVLF